MLTRGVQRRWSDAVSASSQQLGEAYSSGRLKFEIRGLVNEPQKSQSATQYKHRAVIVPVGDPQYTKGI